MLILGTSTCHLLLAEREELVPGVAGVVEDGIVAGMFAYEAGQAAVGDSFAWFVDTLAPADVQAEAARRQVSAHEVLSERAAHCVLARPGWWRWTGGTATAARSSTPN